ncbi:MAG: OmpA family protein, partial [Rhodobacteraceae bacterium]|nr:OmpA family protein [Paracoccaceae bacterium]
NFFATLNVTSIVVDGHTDPRGGYEYNMRLSERRAMAVAQIAQQAGVRISQVRGWGPTKPVAANNTAAGMARNRRVEVICIR